MGSCAAPSAKGDDKFITTDYLQQCLHHHLFENLRRKGHHCHGRKRLSGGRPQKFLPASGQK
ncbi:replication initiator protein [Escherichia coli]|nr:replication initiator protein [Escherichia coli]